MLSGMAYLDRVMDDLGIDNSDLAAQVGVNVDTVRRWRQSTRPRPRLALAVARRFPKAIGAKLLGEWGYSAKPLDYTEESEPRDTQDLILRELRLIRQLLQRPEPIPIEGETE